MSLDWMLIRLKSCAEYLQFSQEFEDIHGYLQDLEGFLLLLLAEQGPGTGAIVEIGSFCGKSTCWLARGSKRARREMVTAVDHFTGSPEMQRGAQIEEPLLIDEGTTFNEFQRNIRRFGLDDYVTAIRASSEEAARQWDRPIRLLFIDADHSYEASRLDFELWSPFVVPGGVIVFHDVGVGEGVTRMYNELLAPGSGYKQLLSVASMHALTRLDAAAAGASS